MRVEFEGQTHEFPDDATEDEIQGLLASAPKAAPQMDGAGRVGGFLARYGAQGLVSGAAGLPALVGDSVMGVGRDIVYGGKLALSKTGAVEAPDPKNYYGEGSAFPASEAVGKAANATGRFVTGGLIEPENAAERVAAAGIEGAAGGLTTGGVGSFLSMLGGRAGGVGRVLAAEPGVQATAGAVGNSVGAGASESEVIRDNLPEWAPSALGMAAGFGTGMAGSAARGAVLRRQERAALPTIDDLKGRAADAYAARDATGFAIEPPAMQRAMTGMRDTMRREGYSERIHTQLGPALDELGDMSAANRGPVDAAELHRLRRLADSAGAEGGRDTGRLAGVFRRQMDDFTGSLQPDEITSGNPILARQFQREGDDFYSRAKKAQMLEDATTRAEDQAATAGSGQNVANTTRQRVRALLTNEKTARRFTPEEQGLLRDRVVRGDAVTNVSRRIGKMFAPTGPLSLSTSLGVVPAIGTAIGGPVLGFASGAAAGIGGTAAKVLSEARTNGAVQRMSERIRRGGDAPVLQAQLRDRAAKYGAQGFLAGQLDSQGERRRRRPYGT